MIWLSESLKILPSAYGIVASPSLADGHGAPAWAPQGVGITHRFETIHTAKQRSGKSHHLPLRRTSADSMTRSWVRQYSDSGEAIPACEAPVDSSASA